MTTNQITTGEPLLPEELHSQVFTVKQLFTQAADMVNKLVVAPFVIIDESTPTYARVKRNTVLGIVANYNRLPGTMVVEIN